tara:strand:- start:22156 stop:22530 length:375 start_codon:yes stop_codon:yes gene_type:complete
MLGQCDTEGVVAARRSCLREAVGPREQGKVSEGLTPTLALVISKGSRIVDYRSGCANKNNERRIGRFFSWSTRDFASFKRQSIISLMITQPLNEWNAPRDRQDETIVSLGVTMELCIDARQQDR